MTTDVPVVVAGAGAAGAVAALRLAERGVPCILIDASQVFPRSANVGMSAGMVPAAGSWLQAHAGVTDSATLFGGDIQRKASGQAPTHLVAALTGVSAHLVDWLAADVGLPLELVTDFVYPGHSVARCHAMPDRNGATLHAGLLDAARGELTIDVVHPVRLAGVQQSPDEQVICDLVTPDGRHDSVRTPALLICSGGFGADRDLVHRFIAGDAEALVYHGAEGSTGDAVRVAETLHLDTGFMDSFQGHGSLSQAGVPLTWAVMVHGGMLVNGVGQRYGNEMVGYSEFAAMTASQPGAGAWAVFDDRIEQQLAKSHDFRVITQSGQVLTADGADALAARLGLDAGPLRDELDQVAAATETGSADVWGRRWSQPLGGRLRAVRVRGALFHTQGGIAVDDRARVLRAGEPVSGLYAAGGAATGLSGHGSAGYLAGNGLLSAMGLGMIAADDVARNADGGPKE